MTNGRETTTPPGLNEPGKSLCTRSLRVCRQHERIIRFEEASNREKSRIGRNVEGNRPLKDGAEENRRQEMNLPPLLAAHLGRSEDGQPSRGQTPSFLFPAETGNASIGGASAYPPQGGHVSQTSQRSLRVCRQHERIIRFEEASNREKSRIGRNVEGNRPLKDGAEENRRQEMNLPPLLAAHLGRSEDGQPSRSSLTSLHGGR
nr:hypothetical protein [Tanacetum cinerariifolium]